MRKKYNGIYKPGEYEKEFAETFDFNYPIQRKGLWWRLLKLYWKKLLFICVCLCLGPAGLWILGIVTLLWIVNWSNEYDAYTREDPEWKKVVEAWKREGVNLDD